MKRTKKTLGPRSIKSLPAAVLDGVVGGRSKTLLTLEPPPPPPPPELK